MKVVDTKVTGTFVFDGTKLSLKVGAFFKRVSNVLFKIIYS